MSKWVRSWEVPGSNGKMWTVSIDMEGDYGCSCPVWKFKRQRCKHIDMVQAGAYCPKTYRHASPGNVGEVTINGDMVIYPLIAFNENKYDLAATIIYDLLRADVEPSEVKSYKEQMFGKKTFKEITDHVQNKGRFIFSRFVTDKGWVDPIYKGANTPLRTEA